jgi:hypothetical protein
MPIETITNASNVPIAVSCVSAAIGKSPATRATTTPVSAVVMYGVLNFG